MVDKNIEITVRNAANTDWDVLYPVTKAENVVFTGGVNVQQEIDAHKEEALRKQDTIDSLNSTDSEKPLSANSGRVVRNMVLINMLDDQETTTTFLPSGDITVDYKQDSSPILSQLIEFNPDGSITETFEFTDRTGTKETIFNPDGSITETYNEVIL